MAASSSRPDSSSPGAVAGATFATVRKGYDPAQVGRFLGEVAAELERLRQRERELEAELAVARAAAADISRLDDAAVTALLGEETARVLSTAREAASQIRTKASEGAERMLREANEEAARVRQQAEVDAAHCREQAEHAAEVERERAKEQGRQMVAEARDYREKVIADGGRRREQARQQLAGYAAARDQLASTFAETRAVVDKVLAELGHLVVDPEELSAPPSEPAPSTPTRVAAAPASAPRTRAGEHSPSEGTGDQAHADAGGPPDAAVAADVQTDREEEAAEPVESAATGDAGGSAAAEPAAVRAAVPAPDGEAVEAVEAVEAPTPAEEHAPDTNAEDEEEPGDERLAPVVALFAGEPPNIPAGEPEITAEMPAVGKASVDDLFARLRAARAAHVAETVQPVAPAEDDTTTAKAPLTVEPTVGEPAGEGTPARVDTDQPEESPFVVRDEALAPIESKLARKLKRALADEQNDILDILRRKDPVRSLDALLPGREEHLRPYLGAADEELPAAALAGARAMSTEDPARLTRRVHDADVVGRTVAHLDEELLEPLRRRLEQVVHAAAGDNAAIGDEVRTIYREWKTVVLDDLAGALARGAYARAGYAVLVPGTPVRWVADPAAAPCPESQANEAAAVHAGEPFPSGDVSPPGHAACRCLLVAIPAAEGATVASTG